MKTKIETAIQNFQSKQIEKAIFIRQQSQISIISLEEQIIKLKEQIKFEKKVIKQAETDIRNYSL
jgi:hypothetical protein